ncbi:ABC transporter ATP-binding protein [Acuticoccus mangrovi]|uniref:ATP-binding cassette domain-containing protein n=1 Tax=Acuticoccus mangrovi TaxID=2796142 RepID=A0A934MH16_9HYPH|nr:oligopeptide/dipeptide ABC transporter ATP-binding protein [Acuticoccus mangrovi]MBJ3776485.1 ATP-binding cassette domain-containing protein [Acuticoccus mangrovi]
MAEPDLLTVDGLTKHFPLRRSASDIVARRPARVLRAVDGISFSAKRGETIGIVGESGCGKSTAGLALLQLLPDVDGSVIFQGRNIVGLPAREIRELRRNMQLVLQNPYSSLDPRMRIEAIVAEPLHNFAIGTRAERRERVRELLARVGLSTGHATRHPHEFSGGQRQRISIARALALNPALIVADEAVSALDVSVQAQILNLMLELKEEFGLTYIFISHDLSVVRYIADRIAVMYLGQIMEIGASEEVSDHPRHPYTEALMSAVPEIDDADQKRRIVLSGELPSPVNPPPGCPFQTRCPRVETRCREEKPVLRDLGGGHRASCHFA